MDYNAPVDSMAPATPPKTDRTKILCRNCYSYTTIHLGSMRVVSEQSQTTDLFWCLADESMHDVVVWLCPDCNYPGACRA